MNWYQIKRLITILDRFKPNGSKKENNKNTEKKECTVIKHKIRI